MDNLKVDDTEIWRSSECCHINDSTSVHVVSDLSRRVIYHENVVQQRPTLQCCDIGSAADTRFCVHAADADAGEFCAYFPADDSHGILDDDDDACYNDHYDDNYQVLNCHDLCVTVAAIMAIITGWLIVSMTLLHFA